MRICLPDKNITTCVVFSVAFILALLMMIASADAKTKRLVLLGDSLTAGYGLDAGDGFGDQLAVALRDEKIDVEVVNAGVSGDTSSGGLARLDWSLGDGADAVIVELGANDALRGVDPGLTRANLEAILQHLQQRKVKILLAGMLAPPNMGNDYGDRFNSIYPELAAKYQVLLYPFFLDGVVADKTLNQRDGIHPNKNGVKIIVERIMPFVRQLLE